MREGGRGDKANYYNSLSRQPWGGLFSCQLRPMLKMLVMSSFTHQASKGYVSGKDGKAFHGPKNVKKIIWDHCRSLFSAWKWPRSFWRLKNGSLFHIFIPILDLNHSFGLCFLAALLVQGLYLLPCEHESHQGLQQATLALHVRVGDQVQPAMRQWTLQSCYWCH